MNKTKFKIEPKMTTEELILSWIRSSADHNNPAEHCCYTLAEAIFGIDNNIRFNPSKLSSGIFHAAQIHWGKKIDEVHSETGNLRASICSIKDELKIRFERLLTEEAIKQWLESSVIKDDPVALKYNEIVVGIYRYVFSSIIKKLELFIAQLDGTVKEISFKELLE